MALIKGLLELLGLSTAPPPAQGLLGFGWFPNPRVRPRAAPHSRVLTATVHRPDIAGGAQSAHLPLSLPRATLIGQTPPSLPRAALMWQVALS